MTTVAADASPPVAFREVWLVSAGHMMTHWYPATFYLLLPLIGRELDLSFSQIGSILTCQFTAGALSNVPGGMVVDAIGRKGLLMAVALSWIGVPYLVMGFSHSYWMLLVCAALVGIGKISGIRPRYRCWHAGFRGGAGWWCRSMPWVPIWAMRSRRWWSAQCSQCSAGATWW